MKSDIVYIVIAITVSAVITFGLRALPFIIFRGERKVPGIIERLGRSLPSTVMAVLIIYCVRDMADDVVRAGIPYIVGILAVAVSYKIKHNTLISILLGTVTYMLMINIIV